MAGQNFISVVSKALTVLESLRDADYGLALKEIARAAQLPKTTTFRILYTLERDEYVEKVAGDGLYRLTSKLMEFAGQKADHRRLEELARPVMAKLVAEFQETVNLGVLEGNHVLYVEVMESPHVFRLAARVGQRGSIHATALGKALAAYLPKDAVEAAIKNSGFPKYTERTIGRMQQFQAELIRVRRRGYATDEQESVEGVRCLAAPILDRSGRAVAGISVSGPRIRMTAAKWRGIVEGLVKGCSEISARLGYKNLAA
ncbi:MAG: IclR family transcriptional regulator [Terriglobia bacterium]